MCDNDGGFGVSPIPWHAGAVVGICEDGFGVPPIPGHAGALAGICEGGFGVPPIPGHAGAVVGICEGGFGVPPIPGHAGEVAGICETQKPPWPECECCKRERTMVNCKVLSRWGAMLGVALAAAPSYGQFESQNVTLKAQIPLSTFGATAGNDCWGYVSPSGREYALMGCNTGTAFVEITIPATPDYFVRINHPSSSWSDIEVYGHYAYVVTEASGTGIQVIDLANIDNHVVTLVRSVPAPQRSHTLSINPSSGFLYTLGSNQGSGTTTCWSLADPSNPVQVGPASMTSTYIHDAMIVSYTSGPYAGKEIFFGCSEGRGVDIYDVTNKNSPTMIKRVTYPNIGYCHQGWLSADRRYFYLDDELDELNGYNNTTRTLVIDVSDIANPRHVSSFTSGRTSTDHNLFWREGFIYEANYTSGFQLFDARSDPLNPTHVGWFDTYPENDAPGYGHGAWTALPFFPSGTVIVNDRDRGLFILDASEARGERMFLSATPLVGGQSTTLSVQGATPSGRVYFIYSLTGEAWTPVNALGVYLNLASPVLAGAAAANGNGEASLVRTVPLSARGRTVWLQAAEAGNTSTVMEEVVQ